MQDPRTGELGGVSDHLFFGEDLCDCNYFLLCESLFDGSVGTEPACRCRRHRRHGFHPWVGKTLRGGNGNLFQYSCWKIPWTEDLAGYSPWGHKEFHTTEHVVYTHTHTHLPGIWVLIIPCLCPFSHLIVVPSLYLLPVGSFPASLPVHIVVTLVRPWQKVSLGPSYCAILAPPPVLSNFLYPS